MTLYLIWEMSEADIGTVTVIIRRMAEISTLFLINGPKMASVLERYTYLTGTAGNADEAVSRIHSFYDVLRGVGTEL